MEGQSSTSMPSTKSDRDEKGVPMETATGFGQPVAVPMPKGDKPLSEMTREEIRELVRTQMMPLLMGTEPTADPDVIPSD